MSYKEKIEVSNTYNEQGQDFKTILATALKNAVLIQKQIVVKQKEDKKNV